MSTRRALALIAPRWEGTLQLYSRAGWLFTLAVVAGLALLLRQWRYVPLLAGQVWATTWLLYTLFQFPLDPDYEFAPQNPQLAMSVMLYLLPHAIAVLLIVGVCKAIPHLEKLAHGGEHAPNTP